MINTSLRDLKAIAEKLEDENTSLEEGVELFEKGVGVIESCAKQLGECKGKVVTLKSRLEALDDIFCED